MTLLHCHATHGEKGEEEGVCSFLGTIHACAKIYGRLHGPAAPGNFHITPSFFFFLRTCLSHDMSVSYPLKFSYSPPFREKVFLEHKLSLLHSLINEYNFSFVTLNLVSFDWHLHLQANNSLSGPGPTGDQ